VVVAAELANLMPGVSPGTRVCGSVTLYKNGQEVGKEAYCLKPPDDDEDEEEEIEEERERRTMLVKTERGIVRVLRPFASASMSSRIAGFHVRLSQADAGQVMWTAKVEFLGYQGESTPVYTEVLVVQKLKK
jgi:hypothetical protein